MSINRARIAFYISILRARYARKVPYHLRLSNETQFNGTVNSFRPMCQTPPITMVPAFPFTAAVVAQSAPLAGMARASCQTPPLPYHSSVSNVNVLDIRKKMHSWTPDEDKRLVEAVREYGTENWTLIAQKVGSGRARAQCSQRWLRGLNPSISKVSWSKEEDDLLIETVKNLGSKSWGKIAAVLGNRCDVQCRYRYNLLVKTQHVENVKGRSKKGKGCEKVKLPSIFEFLSEDQQ